MKTRIANIKPPKESNSIEIEALDLGVFSKLNRGHRDLPGHLATKFFFQSDHKETVECSSKARYGIASCCKYLI